MPATVHQISISNGGVPKLPVPSARVSLQGLEGDWQNDRRYHGGPDRAVCLFPLSLIELLNAEGHPIAPGTIGENLTLAGIAAEGWAKLVPGSRLNFSGGVQLEVVSYSNPCSKIRNSFRDLEFLRVREDLHPGQSRLYSRVLKEGSIATGETFTIEYAG
ncbi:MAG: MOSC domain-containing protein [Planctomycetes bacterium]|nr:MOSC domain-containing protein [Planctomycetota bacterium]